MNLNELKFILDLGVGKKVENYLKNKKYDIKCIRDIDTRMEDKEILEMAVNENRLVITMDKDFGELVFHSGKPHAGVLLLRLEDAPGVEKVKVLDRILKKYKNKLYQKFSVYHNGKLRIRK